MGTQGQRAYTAHFLDVLWPCGVSATGCLLTLGKVILESLTQGKGCSYIVIEEKKTVAMVHVIKNIKSLMMKLFSWRHSHEFSSVLIHMQLFIVQSFLGSEMHRVLIQECLSFIQRVHIEQNEYTIFGGIADDENDRSLLEWLDAGIELRLWCIMKWAHNQAVWNPSPLEKIHIKDGEVILQQKFMVESSPYSYSPRYAKMWCELNHPERKKSSHIYLRQAIWIYMLYNSLFRRILKSCNRLRKCN